jgi:putative oxidoreductase
VKHLGINGNFEIFGLAAALAEVLGGISLITGFLFTPMMLALTGTLAMATIMKLNTTEGFLGYSYPLEMAIVFFGLMIIGPGKYSIDRKISGK